MGAPAAGGPWPAAEPQMHGSTFGGNPLACAAALAALDYIEEHGLAGACGRAGRLVHGAAGQIHSPLIREVRGLGLMVGIELKQKVTPFLQALMDAGCWPCRPG